MVLYMAFFTYKEIVLAAKDGGYMGKPISDIRDEFNKADFNRKKELCVLYADDERKGVKQLVAKYRREEESMAAELKRLDAMKVFERKYSNHWKKVSTIWLKSAKVEIQMRKIAQSSFL